MGKKGFIIMVMILMSNWALAQDLGVTITKVTGECEVLRAGEVKWLKANVDTRLYPNDRIRTKLVSNAELKFDDGTIIEMKENTTLDIKELFESKWTGKTKSEMKLWIGKISGTIEKLKTRDSEFNVHTPVAIIGIRGTKIEVEVGSKGETTCQVIRGEVRMRGLQEAEDKWTTIKENEYSICPTGEKVNLPEIFKPGLIEEEKKEEEKLEPLSEILKKRKKLLREGELFPEEGVVSPEGVEEVIPAEKLLPAPKITAQFPGQDKPFMNKIPNVTVFISQPLTSSREIPTCYLQIEDRRVELPKGATRYSFRPGLKPGPNELTIKAWYQGGQVAAVPVRFPFYDPQPPIIREKRLIPLNKPPIGSTIVRQSGTVTINRIPVEVFVSAEDSGSGIKEVIVNGKRLEKIKEGVYRTILSLELKVTIQSIGVNREVEEVRVIVSDKADNLTIETMEPKKIEGEIKRRLQ